MSHFTVLCIFPTKPEDTAAAVAEALEPYDENTEVPRYRRPCGCVGAAAKSEVHRVFTKDAVDEARKTFKEPPFDKEKYPIFAPRFVEKVWRAHIDPLLKQADVLIQQHPQYNKPDPGCEDCKGKGKVWSTHSKQGYWDWYQIGGRWSDQLNGKNECPLSEVIDKIVNEKDDEGNPDSFTFAVCIDGDWYAAGKMLMFASVKDEDYTFGEKYIKLCTEYLQEQPEAYCCMVDCHV